MNPIRRLAWRFPMHHTVREAPAATPAWKRESQSI
jgi:hypothetical protein